MPLLCQIDLHEAAGDGQLQEVTARTLSGHRHCAIAAAGVPAVRPEVPLLDSIGHGTINERREPASQVSTSVAVLETASEDDRQRGAGHHAELAHPGDRRCQPPTQTAAPMPPWITRGYNLAGVTAGRRSSLAPVMTTMAPSRMS